MYHWLHELLQLVVLRNIEPSMVKHSFTSNFIWCMSSLEKFSSCDIWSRDDKLKPVIDSKFTINILWERERERINKAYSRIVKGSCTIFLTLSLTTLKLKGSYVDEKNKVSNGQTCDGTNRVGPVHLIRSKGLELACCSRLLSKSTGSRQLLCHDSYFLSRDKHKKENSALLNFLSSDKHKKENPSLLIILHHELNNEHSIRSHHNCSYHSRR